MMRVVDEESVIELHRSSIVVDTHCDTLKCLSSVFTRLRDYWFVDRSSLGLRGRADVGHVDIPRLREGGVDCQVFAISSARERLPSYALRTALDMLDIFYSECNKNQGSLAPAKTYQDVLEAVEGGKIAAVLSVEGTDVIEGSLGVLRCFYRLGVRMVGLVHSLRNPLADGVSDSRTGGGLSELGVEVVEELERLGIIFDVSHLSEAGFWDLIEVSRRPIVASHSNCRALCDHPRNLTDDQIRALAKRGGVVGLSFVPQFIHPRNASVQRLVDHIDHIVDLVGPRYVGLGSDFDGMPKTPEGLEDVSKMPNITKELIRRGYPEDEIRMILGENHLRVFREVVG